MVGELMVALIAQCLDLVCNDDPAVGDDAFQNAHALFQPLGLCRILRGLFGGGACLRFDQLFPVI